MASYGGGPKITYQSPKIEKDKSFEKYLEYQMEKDRAAEKRAEDERLRNEERDRVRKEAGAAGYQSFADNVQNQLSAGLIGFNDAQSQLTDYRAKYDMPAGERATALTQNYLENILPGRRQTGITAAYEEILGRAATEEERAKATERFSSGYYSSAKDLRDSLSKGSEYQDKFNKSYLDNYYDTMFGKQDKTEDDKLSGVRTFKFDSSLLPDYSGDLKERSQVELPAFEDEFKGTPAEIEAQLQNVRDSRQFLYSAGLTNLQGEINKETTKLKTEGQKELQKIKNAGDLYKSVVGTFSF